MTARKHSTLWVIVVGAELTSFRARRAEDLLPTLRQLQRTQPTAAMKWFERGRFWDTQEAARIAPGARRKVPGRGPDWRPGGSHQDPRARYKQTRDEKRARFKKRLVRDKSQGTPRTSRAEPTPKDGPPSGPAKARAFSKGRPVRRSSGGRPPDRRGRR